MWFRILVAGVFGWSLAYLGIAVWDRWEPPPVHQLATVINSEKKAAMTNLDTLPAEKEIRADLDALTITLFDGQQTVRTIPILAIGRPGSPWETPVGHYSVLGKEPNHFSSIGEVWMPHSLHFFGNFFIHGWPYYANGQPVGSGYSGGCIRLADNDAQAVFNFAEIGTPVIVTGHGSSPTKTPSGSFYSRRENRELLEISAESYLVADLETGEVLAAREPEIVLPIASVTKLMTAVVSLEAVNQFKLARVTSEALLAYGEQGGLKEGETLTVGDLLYPLLLESSNDAAEVLARHFGRERFVELMNQKARALGLRQTSFVDPSGGGEGNQATANELFQLLRYLYQNKRYVLELSRQAEKILTPNHHWINVSPFTQRNDYLGGKNGETTAARQTLAAVFALPLAEFDHRPIAIILLKSANRDQDANRLLRYLQTNVFFSRSTTDERTPLPTTVTLGFVGDIMFDRGVRRAVEKSGGDFRSVFSPDFSWPALDYLFGNLEGPISERGQDRGNLYSFRMSPVVASVLAEQGFDILSVANNHVGDWGPEAFLDTLKHLQLAGLGAIGGGVDRANASRLHTSQIRGLKVGWLAASDVGPSWLAAHDSFPGIVLADENLLTSVREAANQVDILVVSLHWGEEYSVKPSARQRTLGRSLIDAGAKLVIGHHPHVVQPIEKVGDGLVAYSLGNFIFDQNFSKETMSGILLGVEFVGTELVGWKTWPTTQNDNFELTSIGAPTTNL